MVEAERSDGLLDLALQLEVRKRGVRTGAGGGDQHVDLDTRSFSGFGQVEIEVVVDLPLVGEPASLGAWSAETGQEDLRSRCDGRDLRGPLRRVVVDECFEFWMAFDGGGERPPTQGRDVLCGGMSEEGVQNVRTLHSGVSGQIGEEVRGNEF